MMREERGEEERRGREREEVYGERGSGSKALLLGFLLNYFRFRKERSSCGTTMAPL